MGTGARDLERLSAAVTGRSHSLFASCMSDVDAELRELFQGARILITGGGGFIAGQALRELLGYSPNRVVVADTNENALAELVRDLRVEGCIPRSTKFEPRLLDVTGPLVRTMVDLDGPFDVAMAFAAAKHVRSERDTVSAMHMIYVNVVGTSRIAEAVLGQNGACRLFVVSTDKAADPSSVMGASKRIMEMQILGRYPAATATRFANVAFSTGSLLESWLIRLDRGQTLSVPSDTNRYFVSPAEAGQLCVLATVAPPGAIAVPAQGTVSSINLLAALERLLHLRGERLATVRSLSEVPGVTQKGVRAALVTPRDTAGEKASEVFVGVGERAAAWLPGVDVVRSELELEAADDFAAWISAAVRRAEPLDLDMISTRIGSVLPTFRHVRSDRRLDDRI